ncbi:arginine specific carbamoyl-phosphate synthase Arg4 [Schizosaccharomyces pombe]|uniref:Carbamoyl phosphate synthase arginine-specific large chain, mitochondrial n=1 Tax=Schizosaccharomyces pombe (strain 972 / ATCC 24843) TaxID=284812 RepID=CARB_SCHPO|nr:putative arginine specific carbamoyl-phosphate synthase Arg4 [Schizosaccharomyces pombe]O94313.1 RecName: Full=Carbamoyl phosphate synthase arginine-specific large chain, mitochondrial; Short=CPS; Short=CPSase; AltName: Full=Ammonium-dependent carbamoyl phosphate synthetase; AltName: Full=Arginine-specific carbamoyl phosphate synthetase, ammonia chain; AltName: Full=Glutamine-dependent carbamoyl phosphate synthetase [Schizosaccharomyces pombe 972h-]CAA22122.1 arginine specific carbamoyl-phosph|eukprot:NP_596685.1 putative arginine specific carbamoyl-phosphate synthase Arg4 [Schizosaccharomyces pombe]
MALWATSMRRAIPGISKAFLGSNRVLETAGVSQLSKHLLPQWSGVPHRKISASATNFNDKVKESNTPDANAYIRSGHIKAAEHEKVKKVVVVGSGGLSIGQAGEFDYSGAQAIKALRESSVHTILINPNIATIQSSHSLADEIYFLPVTAEYLTHLIERENPDGILLTFGGQTALNVGIQLDDMGVFARNHVKVLGTPISTLKTSEDRDLFAKALNEINIPIAESVAVSTVDEALQAAEKVSYPVIIRSAYSLGGLGSGFANNKEELQSMAAKSLSLTPQILVEKSLKGWKEVEYEVVRDAANNCITVCNMENFDPLGIHTGDSIVVAPSQTLSDEEYHMLRTAAIKIIRHLGVVGECNVQYALSPNSLEYRVIEVNARLSRSSALASKATGYPLAYTAAKIALGHTLPELPNAVTKTTTANFEPSLDYVVTKIPRWDLSKFQYVNREIGSSMKSVGEVMAVGRTFEESLQKALRQVDPSFLGFMAMPFKDLDNALSVPTDRRFFAVVEAMLNQGYSIDKIHDLTKIDKWFLSKLANMAKVYKELEEIGSLYGLNKEIMLRAKKTGFSDLQISKLVGASELDVRARRKRLDVHPWVKKIDTLAAEFPAHTNYLYTSYNASSHDIDFNEHGTMVLGSGVYRIGSSVEFDWCGVSCARTLRKLGHSTIMVNYNPETVSTDFDECERLYFEELSYERVMDIYEMETASGIVVSVGGQLPQNIALKLQETGAKVLGTDPLMIDSAEDRHKFSQILDKIGVDQPAWKELTSVAEASKFANAVGYPVLVRPSYVLSGAAMSVIRDESSLKDKLENASAVSPDHPVVITKFIEGARELDVDAVASKGKLLVHAVSEHVENAGVHSGDATIALPPYSLSEDILSRCKEIAEKVCKAFQITGPYNMQIILAQNPDKPDTPDLKVIECNLRASRSFPFVSKTLGVNFIDVATRSIIDQEVPAARDLMAVHRDYVCVKVPQFSWTRLAGADPYLGVEMSSTGEVACFGKDVKEAYWAALQSTQNFKIPLPGQGILLGGDRPELAGIAADLSKLGYKLYVANKDAAKLLQPTSAEVVEFPVKDKRALRAIFEKYNIRSVFNLASARGKNVLDQDYVMRRNAVDFNVTLINDVNCAKLFVESLKEKLPSVLSEKKEMPSEVKRWSEWIGSHDL